MTGDPGGIQHGALILPHPPDVLVSVADGRASRGLLSKGTPGFQRDETWGPSTPPPIGDLDQTRMTRLG